MNESHDLCRDLSNKSTIKNEPDSYLAQPIIGLAVIDYSRCFFFQVEYRILKGNFIMLTQITADFCQLCLFIWN